MERKWRKKIRQQTESESLERYNPRDRKKERDRKSVDRPHKSKFSHDFQPAHPPVFKKRKRGSKKNSKQTYRQADLKTCSIDVRASASQEEQQGNELDILAPLDGWGERLRSYYS